MSVSTLSAQIQRFAIDMYTTSAAASLTRSPTGHWRAAAFGSSAGAQGLAALPGVRRELENIVRDPKLNTHGVLPGTIWLDRDFTAQALKNALDPARTLPAVERPNVLHIASHFILKGGPAESYVLLGDGSRLTLADLTKANWRFDEMELVTLSACQTGQSGTDRFGQEVEGLGNLLQGQGAAAVLATLWPVDDQGTAQVMRGFYQALESQPGLSKAEAMRRAQLQLIGRPTSAASTLRGRSAQVDRGAVPDDPPDAPQSKPLEGPDRLSHPYFWAPFVLMGNWL